MKHALIVRKTYKRYYKVHSYIYTIHNLTNCSTEQAYVTNCSTEQAYVTIYYVLPIAITLQARACVL